MDNQSYNLNSGSTLINTLLDDLLYKNDSNQLIFLIKNTNSITNILEFLVSDSNSADEKIFVIDYLTKNFKDLPQNSDIFLKFTINYRNTIKKANLAHLLISIYIEQDDPNLNYAISQCLNELISNVDFNKNFYDLVFQSMSRYFRGENPTKSEFSRYLEILKILYGEHLNTTTPSNYIFFSGIGSLKVNENDLKAERIKLSQGCVISFWFMINLSFNTSELVNMKLSKDQSIILTLIKNKLLINNYSEKEYVAQFNTKQWNHISLIIKPKTFLRNAECVLILNDSIKSYPISNNITDQEITDITFFKNFVGQVTSIMYFNKCINEEYVKQLREFSYGFYKEKNLYQLMKKANHKYLENSDLKIRTQMNLNKDAEGLKIVLENVKFLYIPFRSSGDRILYDACGRINAAISYDAQNGIHIYRGLPKNIFLLGGINSILPIVEIMYTNMDTLLTADSFCNYVELIYIILNYRQKNMNDAVNKNFFQMLSLFIEKFPKKIFNGKLLELLLKLGRALFSLVDQCGLITSYFDQILLNEKIFTNFEMSLQIDMWRSLYQFYISDDSQIKSFMRMNKICLVLRYYDSDRFKNYCCKYHYAQFYGYKRENSDSDMSIKIYDLINIVQLIIDNHNPESDDAVYLLKLLSLDLSPCLQKYILKVFVNYFNLSNCNNLSYTLRDNYYEKRKKCLSRLLLHGYFLEIMLYVISISLIDIRCEAVKLFNILSNPVYRDLMKKVQDKIYSFLSDFILPDNLLTHKNKSSSNMEQRERSPAFSNKKEPTKKVDSLNIIDEDLAPAITDIIPNYKKNAPVSSRYANRSTFKFDSEKVDLFIKKKGSTSPSKLSTKIDDVIKENMMDLNSINFENPPPTKSKFKKSIKLDLDNHENSTNINTETYLPKIENELSKSLETNEFEPAVENPFTGITKSHSGEVNLNFNSRHLSPVKSTRTINEVISSTIRIKKKLGGFNNKSDLNLDIDSINKKYKFGGEKAELNMDDEAEQKEFESKIRELAKHCVNFINGSETFENCKIYANCNMNYEEEREDQILPNLNPLPRSINGSSKFIIPKISIENLNKIEEEREDLFNSAHKSTTAVTVKTTTEEDKEEKTFLIKENATGKDISNLTEIKQKLSFENLDITTNISQQQSQLASLIEKGIDIVDDYILTDKITSETINNTILNQELFTQNKFEGEVENLDIYFNKEIYNENLSNLYSACIQLLLNKTDTINISKENKELILDDKDNIINQGVIDVLVKLVLKSDIVYTEKLIQDLHLLCFNNKENCLILYKNSLFCIWLIETCFRHYQTSKGPSNEINNSLTIYELGKKIHTEIIINSISSDVKSEPMNKINFLLSLGLYYKNLYDYNRIIESEVNSFIKELLKDLLSAFKDKVNTCSPNVDLAIWENFLCFTILCHEYMAFYNLEKTLKNNPHGLAELSYDCFSVPQCVLWALNKIDFSQNYVDNLSDMWADYNLFDSIYMCYSRIWSINRFSLSNLTNLIVKYEKMIEEYINNKKRKDIFMDELKILTYYYKSDFSNSFIYNIPVIKAISNLFTITISRVQEEGEIKRWLFEYEQFLIFLIIASSNLSMNTIDYYSLVQDLCLDTILFGICYMLDEYMSPTKKNPNITKLYAVCIKNVFVLCVMIMESYSKLVEKEKKKNIFRSLIKTKKTDYSKSCVYRIFNEYILDTNGNVILTPKVILELKLSQFVDVPEIFRRDIWRQALIESKDLKEKLKYVYDFSVYESIIIERNQVIKNINPVYEYLLSINNGLNLITKPQLKPNTIKIKIYKSIEVIIPHFELEIKLYQNNLFKSNKQRKKFYRWLKKKLFSWRGMWSDRELFFLHPEKLKLKIFNHYTNYFSRPILVPVLDIDYYMPQFSRFKISDLFHHNQKNCNYKFSLDIDKILISTNLDLEEVSEVSDEKSDNFIKDIYKLNHYSIWCKYTDINSKMQNFSIKDYQYNELYLNKFKTNSNDPNLRKYETIFECCFVKCSHHIKGLFSLDKEGITFRILISSTSTNNMKSPPRKLRSKISFDVIDNEDDHFNYDRNTCYGSFFENHPRDKDTISYFIPYNEMRYILKRRYYYKKTGIEIFSAYNKSYYFCFKEINDRQTALKVIVSNLDNKREIKIDTKENVKDKEELIIGYENLSTFTSNLSPLQPKKNIKSNYLSYKIESWMNWKISNFEFLMWLNLIGNRSYSDLTQYPVFPWIIKNYINNIIQLPKDIRDFDTPMGMMEIDEKAKIRKKCYIDDYRGMLKEPDMNEAPRVYGSHYSNPMYVAHYLTRLFPYSHIMIELQGDRFDDPNRLFLSVSNSFTCASSLKGDLRELTPEFYFLPELFININNLNMGVRTDFKENKQAVHNVQLPEWSDNNPYEFVIKMRTILESEEVSIAINNWIDLIFGYKQRGKEAENIYNIFPIWSYEDFNIGTVDPCEKASFLAQLEFGLTPTQLITSKPLTEKFTKDHIRRGRQITESRELKSYGNNNRVNNKNRSKDSRSRALMLKIKVLDNDKVMCVFNNNTYSICKFSQNNEFKYNMDSVTKTYISHDIQYKIGNRMKNIYNECLINHPIIVYNQGKVIAQAGYWDGKIAVSYQENSNMKLFYYYVPICTPIICLVIDKEEQWVFAGTKLGILYIFKVNDYLWKVDTTLYDHTQEINYISISNSLNIFATSSTDGYVNLYTFPGNKLFRCLQMRDNVSADYVFLSSSPLPSVTVYSKSSKMFYSYSINGFLLCEEFDDCKYIMSPIVLTDISFCDYLIYGTNTGEFKIRKFPNMSLHLKLVLVDNKPKTEAIPIKCIDITEDKKFAYVWLLDDQDITLIKDPSVTSEAATVNLINMGFGY